MFVNSHITPDYFDGYQESDTRRSNNIIVHKEPVYAFTNLLFIISIVYNYSKMQYQQIEYLLKFYQMMPTN